MVKKLNGELDFRKVSKMSEGLDMTKQDHHKTIFTINQ